MKKKEIPSWIWVLIAFLILIIMLLIFNFPSGNEYTTTTTDGEYNTLTTYKEVDTATKKIDPIIIDLCENQKTLCDAQVRVYGEDRDCYDEYNDCLIR